MDVYYKEHFDFEGGIAVKIAGRFKSSCSFCFAEREIEHANVQVGKVSIDLEIW